MDHNYKTGLGRVFVWSGVHILLRFYANAAYDHFWGGMGGCLFLLSLDLSLRYPRFFGFWRCAAARWDTPFLSIAMGCWGYMMIRTLFWNAFLGWTQDRWINCNTIFTSQTQYSWLRTCISLIMWVARFPRHAFLQHCCCFKRVLWSILGYLDKNEPFPHGLRETRHYQMKPTARKRTLVKSRFVAQSHQLGTEA